MRWYVRREEDWGPVGGCANAFLIMIVAGLVVLAAIIGWRWYSAPPPEPEMVFVPPMVHPVTGEPSDESFCLALVSPEVSEEPDYELRSGKECE